MCIRHSICDFCDKCSSSGVGKNCRFNVCYHLLHYATLLLRFCRFSSLLTVGYLLITAHEMKSYLAHRRGNTSSDEKSPRTRPSRTPTTLTESAASTIPGTSRHSSLPLTVTFPETTHRRGTNDIIQITQTGSPDPQNTPRLSEISRSRRPRRRNWFADFDPMLLGITIFQILVFGYFIVSSELLRARNPSTQNDDGIWGFGQVHLGCNIILQELIDDFSRS